MNAGLLLCNFYRVVKKNAILTRQHDSKALNIPELVRKKYLFYLTFFFIRTNDQKTLLAETLCHYSYAAPESTVHEFRLHSKLHQ